jgi:HSP20 family protein
MRDQEEAIMAITIRNAARDPVLADFFSLSNRLSRFLNDGLGSADWQLHDSASAAWVPAVDILEEPEAIRIMAEVPGVKPEDVRISVENNVLTIHGSKQQTAEERTERVHRYERAYGGFERTFTLPTTVDASNIKATYEHGVLTVTLPKVEKAKPRQIEVQVAAK